MLHFHILVYEFSVYSIKFYLVMKSILRLIETVEKLKQN